MNEQRQIEPADLIVVRRRRTLLIAALAGIALVLALAAWAMGRSAGDEAAAGQAAGQGAGRVPNVTVVVPGRSTVARTIAASGPLAARRDQPVGISGGGGRVTAVLVDANQWVGQGQVLARVERSVQSQLAVQQQAQIAAARANAALAQNNFDRAQALVPNGFISKAELDAKRAARDAAQAQVRVAEAALGQTRAQIGQLDIRAPSAGLVLSRSVEVGQVVGAGAGALFRLAAGGEMEMRARLSQQELALVRAGMTASVTPVGSTRAYAGTVWQVAPVIDPQDRQGDVRIRLPYDAALRPGGFAEARIAAGSQVAPLLPQSAVLSDSRGNYVFLVNGKNEVERRDVVIGSVVDNGVIIGSGLSGTETVVLSAGPFLNPGQKVAPRKVAATATR